MLKLLQMYRAENQRFSYSSTKLSENTFRFISDYTLPLTMRGIRREPALVRILDRAIDSELYASSYFLYYLKSLINSKKPKHITYDLTFTILQLRGLRTA